MKTIVFEVFGFQNIIREKLKILQCEFTEEAFFCDFWGTRFIIKKPVGRGSGKKYEAIQEVVKMYD